MHSFIHLRFYFVPVVKNHQIIHFLFFHGSCIMMGLKKKKKNSFLVSWLTPTWHDPHTLLIQLPWPARWPEVCVSCAVSLASMCPYWELASELCFCPWLVVAVLKQQPTGSSVLPYLPPLTGHQSQFFITEGVSSTPKNRAQKAHTQVF